MAFPKIKFKFTPLPTPDTTEDIYAPPPPWSQADLPFRCFSAENDPFDDISSSGAPRERKRREAFDQVLSQAEVIVRHQQRTFLFMLIFVGLGARLLRFDRSSLFITRRFELADSAVLSTFLTRYSQLSPADRGYDTSAEFIDPLLREPVSLVEKMREHLQDAKERKEEGHIIDMWEASLDDRWPWWKLRVPDELTHTDRWFVVGKPSFQAPGVFGRGTRCYIAIELFTREGDKFELDTKFVHLKDCWRVVAPDNVSYQATDIRKEGDTLEKLNRAKVERVPTLIGHSDIKGQDTSASPRAWKKVNPKFRCRLKTHQHYRLVVEEIGKPLWEFAHSGELVLALYDCIQGASHGDAMRVNVMHRDNSGGNILLYRKKGDPVWHGLLTDWELSLDSEVFPEPRRHRRVGTPQFSAARALDFASTPIGVADELESFFHVLIYYAVRFLKHNLPDESVGLFIHKYFDESSGFTQEGELTAPALKRESMVLGRIGLNGSGVCDSLRFMWVDRYDAPQDDDPATRTAATPHPLNRLIDILLSWFSALYALPHLSEPSSRPAPEAPPVAPRGGRRINLGERRRDVQVPRIEVDIQPNQLYFEKAAEMRLLAAHLDDHSNVLALIEKIAVQPFPTLDKGKDKSPENAPYSPFSPETPQVSEVSCFTALEEKADGPLAGTPAVGLNAPLDVFTAKLPVGAANWEKDRLELCAAATASKPQENELNGPHPSSRLSSSRPKRGREDDAPVPDTSSKRSKC